MGELLAIPLILLDRILAELLFGESPLTPLSGLAIDLFCLSGWALELLPQFGHLILYILALTIFLNLVTQREHSNPLLINLAEVPVVALLLYIKNYTARYMYIDLSNKI